MLFHKSNFFCAIFFVSLLISAYKASASEQHPANSDTVRASIKSIWRDPGASLVVQTDYGEFFYIYDSVVLSRDGKDTYRLDDHDFVLLKAILSSNNGSSVDIYVSTKCDGVIVGINGASVPFEKSY